MGHISQSYKHQPGYKARFNQRKILSVAGQPLLRHCCTMADIRSASYPCVRADEPDRDRDQHSANASRNGPDPGTVRGEMPRTAQVSIV